MNRFVLQGSLWVPASDPAFGGRHRTPVETVRKGRKSTGTERDLAAATLAASRDYQRVVEQHALGQVDAMAQVVTLAAFLRSIGRIGDRLPVLATGAKFQDGRGTDDHPAAHRLPANIVVGWESLADYARWNEVGLRDALRAPFAVTDILPRFANEVDSMTEKLGAVEAERLAVLEVLEEQPAGKPVSPSLVRHVVEGRFVPAVLAARERGLDLLGGRRLEQVEALLAPSGGVGQLELLGPPGEPDLAGHLVEGMTYARTVEALQNAYSSPLVLPSRVAETEAALAAEVKASSGGG